MSSKIENRQIESLYVHIPFCEHICFFCDFVKVIKPKEEKAIFNYLENLESEINSYGEKLNFIKTIYIGGGTPSCLNEEQTIKLCEILKPLVKETEFEYTIEINPESLTESKLEIYKNYHINRLSIGVQTFDNKLLKKIGRIHDNKMAIEKFKLARSFGFNNISIDLMYNLFDQTKEHIENDLNYIESLRPEHISWYSLIMKEDSAWGKKQLKLPDNDELFDDIVNEGLVKLGYKRYEISNYALNGAYSKHNTSYWNNSLFVGVGVGATGFEQIDGDYYLTSNKGKVDKYSKNYEKLTTDDYYFQILMMGLRMIDGIDITVSKNIDAYNHFYDLIQKKVKENLLEIVDNKLRCTTKGFNILNEILIDFL